MKWIKTVGLCLLATLALAAVVASTAQAEEQHGEVGQCNKTEKVGKYYHGGYTNRECTTKATLEEESEGGKLNKYKWQAGAGHKAEYTEKGRSVLIKGGAAFEVECTASVGKGKFKSATLGNYEFTFTGCKSLHKEHENTCKSHGAANGEINVTGLETEILGHGDAKKGKGLTGEPASGEAWVNYYAAKEEAPFASFECEGVPIELLGSLAAVNTGDINLMSKKALNSLAEGKGEQALKAKYYDSFTKETKETAVDVVAELALKYEEKYEIRA